MMFIVKWALGWVTGGGLNVLKDIWFKYKDSAIESERIEAEWAKAKLDAILQVRLATAGFWEMRLITFLIAVPFVFHLWTVWLDTQFQFGWKIAAFPSPFNEWQGAILLSFFGVYAAGKVGMGLVSSLAAKR
jgi:hypothetical protein